MNTQSHLHTHTLLQRGLMGNHCVLLGGRAQNTLRRSSLQKHTHTHHLSRTFVCNRSTLRNSSAALWERPPYLLARNEQEVSPYLLRSRLPKDAEALRADYLIDSGRFRVGFITLPPCDVAVVHRCFWKRLQPLKISFFAIPSSQPCIRLASNKHFAFGFRRSCLSDLTGKVHAKS